jgi:hypothetical protein
MLSKPQALWANTNRWALTEDRLTKEASGILGSILKYCAVNGFL